MLFVEKQCKRTVKYAIISFFVIVTCGILASGYIFWEFALSFKPMVLLLALNYLMPSTVRDTNHTSVPSNNTIYILDEYTTYLGGGGGASGVRRHTNPFINVTDVFIAIHEADKERPLKVVVSTFGGNLLGCQKIIRRLRAHPSGYRVYCNEALSAGAMITIAADEIIMDKYSRVGKIDPVKGKEARLLASFHKPDTASIHPMSDIDLMIKDSVGILNSFEIFLSENVPNYTEKEKVIKENLIYSDLHHGTSFGQEDMRKWGFNIREPTKEESVLYFGYFQS